MQAVGRFAEGPGTRKGQWSRTGGGHQGSSAVDASIAFTHEQQHYRYGCFAQAFCGLKGLRA